ncbi:MAG: hypothetical protein QX199_18435 [Methylococcaceae bacterium]
MTLTDWQLASSNADVMPGDDYFAALEAMNRQLKLILDARINP